MGILQALKGVSGYVWGWGEEWSTPERGTDRLGVALERAAPVVTKDRALSSLGFQV